MNINFAFEYLSNPLPIEEVEIWRRSTSNLFSYLATPMKLKNLKMWKSHLTTFLY